jgi:hypothetical protein
VDLTSLSFFRSTEISLILLFPYSFIYVCIGSTEVWTLGLAFVRQVFYHLSYNARLFCFNKAVVLPRSSFRQWPCYLSLHIAGITGTCYHALLIFWMECHLLFAWACCEAWSSWLCLLNSCDYRHVPQCPALEYFVSDNLKAKQNCHLF